MVSMNVDHISDFCKQLLRSKVNMDLQLVSIGPKPNAITCPSCQAQIVTRVQRRPTTRTHIMAVLLCVFLCWPCVCVPYCMDSCNNADHYCPSCNAYLGSYIS